MLSSNSPAETQLESSWRWWGCHPFVQYARRQTHTDREREREREFRVGDSRSEEVADRIMRALC